ncbi:MFS transporter [Pseudomonas fluorescens]|uniref:MFS transporter n=1 Tax=Pseudomonas fluorescens TaxID=294 RepID=A0A1T2XZ89_PSEFL|nr:MFS transporter [Pseudomonas fluorescens]OPA85152.1 MFS transporter [Pseudomonas fluorescens]
MRKDYLAFFVSLFMSRLADQILLFIVPLVVFQTTNSVSWAGLAFFVESLPRYLAFPICGALCDRISPVRILHISQIYRALVCVVAVALYGMFDGIYWLVILSAICGVLTTQGIMAREVLMPHVFKDYSYAKTLSYSQIADQSGLVLGPLVAALMLEVWAWHWVVIGVAGLFVLADVAMRIWQSSTTDNLEIHPHKKGPLLQPLLIAFTHIARLNELKRIIVLAVGINLLYGVIMATSAAMVTGQYAESKDSYALLQTASALVTISILFYLARSKLTLKLMGGLSYTMMTLGALIMAISPTFWGYTLGFLVMFGFEKMFSVYMRSTRQRVIPVKDFGKTVGVITLLNNLAQPLAGLMIALLAAPLGTQTVILLLTGITALLGVAVASGWYATVEAELEVG